ncbi:hypothetical protein IWX50DRAFT_198040 [Phyllosticta citricarpa]|uniref:Uncharacterized protein n=1 Tax=Phyllosticta citricarpa TaxID=55181 RepID=A0ABR1MG20_9PEZI
MPPRLATSLPITNHGINHGISNCSILIAAHPDALKSAALAISEEAWSHNRVPLDHSFGSWLCVLGFNEPFHRLHVDMRNREQPVVETDHHQTPKMVFVASWQMAGSFSVGLSGLGLNTGKLPTPKITISTTDAAHSGFRVFEPASASLMLPVMIRRGLDKVYSSTPRSTSIFLSFPRLRTLQPSSVVWPCVEKLRWYTG